MPPGTYRNITGNLALAYGLVAGGVQSGLPLFLGLLPDHPGLRHPPRAEQAQGLRRHHVPGRGRDRRHRRRDRRRPSPAASASPPPPGPGIALKSEAIGLAVMTELPLLVIDVQRGGPSTGLPTKTEQADLLQAMFGRNGEAPVPIVAPQSPGDCFDAALEAARIAVTYRTPVMLLSDGYLANGSEPWRIPEVADLPDDRPRLRHRGQPRPRRGRRGPEFWPYLRDEETLARPWAIPGTAGPRAPHRRPGEGRRPRQHLLRPGQPRLHGPHPPGQGRPDRRLAAAARGRRPRAARPRCSCSAGARRTARSAPAYAGCARPATTSRRRTCATSTRSRRTSARS